MLDDLEHFEFKLRWTRRACAMSSLLMLTWGVYMVMEGFETFDKFDEAMKANPDDATCDAAFVFDFESLLNPTGGQAPPPPLPPVIPSL